MRFLITVVLALYFSLPLGAKDFVKDVKVIKHGDSRTILRVELSRPTALKVYYDTQKPSQGQRLERFWFSYMSRKVVKMHRILLPDIRQPDALYFRLEKVTGKSRATGMYVWRNGGDLRSANK